VTFTGKRTVVITDVANRSVLPVDEQARMIFSLKGNLKWDISEALTMVLEVYYSWDDNQIRYVSDFSGLNVISQFVDPNIMGMNLAAQARF
jgi:hypothetical protein